MRSKFLENREDFDRYEEERKAGFLALKNYLREVKKIERKLPREERSYLRPFLSEALKKRFYRKNKSDKQRRNNN